MDSVTQAALGAAVGVAVMGRARPVWQSALTGALVGTLPDLDVFIDYGDPIRNMVLHRAETHALFWQALAAPVIAGALALTTRSRHLFPRWWLLVILVLFTHSLLDAMTVYGTRIALPFSDRHYGLGSLFIIDPLYTLPLLFGLLMTSLLRGSGRRRWNTAGLVLSTLYAGWSFAAQTHVLDRVRATPEARGLSEAQILVVPTPFNTLLWRVVLMHDDRYSEGFHSLLDPPQAIRFEHYDRGRDLDLKTADFADADLIRDFSKGFYSLDDDGHAVRITDLRMGVQPYYTFSFAFAAHSSEPLVPIEPLRVGRRVPFRSGIAWLWERMRGMNAAPPERPER